MKREVIQGDCLDVLRDMPENSVDAVVTDPPYGLGTVKDLPGLLAAWATDADDRDFIGSTGFMSSGWDAGVPAPRYWREVLRVLKPGGHALVFAGTRTQDLMGISLRLSGFHLKETIMWAFGSGFPKSLNVGKAIDRELGATREVIATETRFNEPSGIDNAGRGSEARTLIERNITAPATPEAAKYDGYGTQIKPAYEPILICRKPLSEKNVARNVLAWGTGGLNIDGCRVGTEQMENRAAGNLPGGNSLNMSRAGMPQDAPPTVSKGRFPANLILDEEAARVMDGQSGVSRSKRSMRGVGLTGSPVYGTADASFDTERGHTDSGGASRFFKQVSYEDEDSGELSCDRFIYQSKASRRDRNEGLEGMPVAECANTALRDGGRGGKTGTLKLRNDLTEEEIEYVKRELIKVGVSL